MTNLGNRKVVHHALTQMQHFLLVFLCSYIME